jgi:hypothetical protein
MADTVISKEDLPPIAAAQLDLCLIDDDLLSTLFGEGIEKMFWYFSANIKRYGRLANTLFRALSFWFSIGMGYPTPAMIAFNMQLAKRTTKGKIALWMFYSTILPSLWDYLIHKVEKRITEGEEHDEMEERNGTESSLASSSNPTLSTTHKSNKATQQILRNNRERRRHLILWACATSISKILPIIQLVHFLQFIHSTTKQTSSKSQSTTEATTIIPPTLAMRLAGITYTTSSPNVFYYYNITYAHQRMMWNHVKHFILQVGGEEGARRIMSLLFPPHPTSIISGDARRESLTWLRWLMRACYQTRHILRLWWWPSSLTESTSVENNQLKSVARIGYNNVKENYKKPSPTSRSSPNYYCPICLTKDIRNPYEALPCHHVHCYMCLRTEALGCVTKAQQQHLNNINTCCLHCGKPIISSRRL